MLLLSIFSLYKERKSSTNTVQSSKGLKTTLLGPTSWNKAVGTTPKFSTTMSDTDIKVKSKFLMIGFDCWFTVAY